MRRREARRSGLTIHTIGRWPGRRVIDIQAPCLIPRPRIGNVRVSKIRFPNGISGVIYQSLLPMNTGVPISDCLSGRIHPIELTLWRPGFDGMLRNAHSRSIARVLPPTSAPQRVS
jgi:hypothetical protein